MYFLISGIAFYLSLCGFLAKAGHPFWKGLIPIYNLSLFLSQLNIEPITLIILGLLLIFLPDGMLFVTLMYVFFPFIVSYGYGKGFFVGILALIFPFVMYPLLAFVLD